MTTSSSDQANSRILAAQPFAMFPLDPWVAEQVFALVDHPHPGIARAMVLPVVLGDAGDVFAAPLDCLAVSADGGFTARLRLPPVGSGGAQAVWAQLAQALNQARSASDGSGQVGHAGGVLTAADSFKAWTDASTWLDTAADDDGAVPAVPYLAQSLWRQSFGAAEPSYDDILIYEQQALAQVRRQVSAAAAYVLGALRGDVWDIVSSRPRLSIGMACQLVALASAQGINAVMYALQALRTESIGLLNMVTSGQPQVSALALRSAIFNGDSLPATFEDLGVAKATHKLSRIQPAPRSNVVVDHGVALCELAISGRVWLTAMRLAKHVPLHTDTYAQVYASLVRRLVDLDLLNAPVALELLQWSAKPLFKLGTSRLESLITLANKVIEAAKGLADLAMPLHQAVALVLKRRLRGQRGDPDDPFYLLSLVAQLTGLSVRQLTQSVFDALPSLPKEFAPPVFTRITALGRLDLAIAHGQACNNCLTAVDQVLNYVTGGTGLYGVYTQTGAAATIALVLDVDRQPPCVTVLQVTGIKNAPAGADLERLAQTLAQSWALAAREEDWMHYAAACQAWWGSSRMYPKFISIRNWG